MRGRIFLPPSARFIAKFLFVGILLSFPVLSISQISFGAASAAGTSASLPVEKDDGVSEPYASETGKFGLSIMVQYNVLQSPAPIHLFQNGIGGDGELSYGLFRGIRILGGFGYLANTPHIAPPLQSSGSSGPSNQYFQAYLGGQLEMTRWVPQMIRYQPWFPYFRADVGNVFASISGAGLQTGHPDGLMADAGVGIEGRPRALPMAFFGEVRSQWIFLGPQIMTVVPVLVGTTFYF